MITLEPLTRENLRAVVGLRLRDEQADLIDSNAFSIAQAYVEPAYTPLAIVANSEPVGFVLVCQDIDTGSGWIISFMIDQRHQRQGYGRAALLAVLERFQAQPHYHETRLSYYQGNDAAAAFYTSAGFDHTGEIDDDGEVYMSLRAPTADT